VDLAPFTIDEYENALYHTNPLRPCILFQEIHQTLLNVKRQDALRELKQVLPFIAAIPLPVDDGLTGESDDEAEDKHGVVGFICKLSLIYVSLSRSAAIPILFTTSLNTFGELYWTLTVLLPTVRCGLQLSLVQES
jgi:hypothetical protein